MSEPQAIARLKIHDGRLEEFKRLAARCMESVRTRDSGTLEYSWFLSGDLWPARVSPTSAGQTTMSFAAVPSRPS